MPKRFWFLTGRREPEPPPVETGMSKDARQNIVAHLYNSGQVSRLGWTQREVADFLGVNPSTITRDRVELLHRGRLRN